MGQDARERSYVDEHGFGRVARVPTPTGYAVGDINTYLVLPEPGDDTLVLIDTGVGDDRAWSTLSEGFKHFGFAIEDLSLLVLTHAHRDQCCGLYRTGLGDWTLHAPAGDRSLLAPEEHEEFWDTYQHNGCPECRNIGYSGRHAIFELMDLSNEIREMILKEASAVALRDMARKRGMRTLAEDGWRLVNQGITSPDEVLRVTKDQSMEDNLAD